VLPITNSTSNPVEASMSLGISLSSRMVMIPFWPCTVVNLSPVAGGGERWSPEWHPVCALVVYLGVGKVTEGGEAEGEWGVVVGCHGIFFFWKNQI